MPKNDEARRREDAETAARLAALLSSDNLTAGQDDLLSDILLDLSNDTGVSVYSAEVVAAFYLAATRRKGSARHRSELTEALRLIEAGERFDDYIGDDGVTRWRMRRRVRSQKSVKLTAEKVHKALIDVETPGDYRALLGATLRAFARIAGTDFDASDPRETYLEARSECAIFPGRPGLTQAHATIDLILRGLETGQPLEVVMPGVKDFQALTAPVAPTPATEDVMPEGGAVARISELTARLDRFYEPENEAARFRIEREIFDLEHAAECAEDEWPELVAA